MPAASRTNKIKNGSVGVLNLAKRRAAQAAQAAQSASASRRGATLGQGCAPHGFRRAPCPRCPDSGGTGLAPITTRSF